MRDFMNADFPDGSGDAAHVDIWQPFGVPGDLSDHNVFEHNWASDNRELNSHFNQIRDETRPRSGEKEFVIRGNVALRVGSYACDHKQNRPCHQHDNDQFAHFLAAGQPGSPGVSGRHSGHWSVRVQHRRFLRCDTVSVFHRASPPYALPGSVRLLSDSAPKA